MNAAADPVQFVGTGPGAADLLTVRAVRLLEAADTVLYPGSYLDADVLESCSAAAELVDTQHLHLDEIVARIVDAHSAGRRVVRLVSGDPSLYSAVSEQTRRLDSAVVLTRTQARSTAMPDTESLAAFAATHATLVLHLAITAIRALMDELAPTHGRDCPVVVVYRASQPEELVLRGTVADIADQVEAAGLRQAAVILVGEALGERADPRAGESHLYDPQRDRSASR
jgi:precorrin-4/cobalt-precorrin-4 C11-methyltransferase